MQEKWFTAPKVGKILGIGSEAVLDFIRRGELRAINTSRGERPRWKISPQDFELFCQSRSNQSKAEKQTKKVRRELPKPTKSYF